MTTDVRRERAIRRATVRATRAPSVHNTQPWRLVVCDDGVELYADPTRQLRVLDPHGRQLLLSCGCALFNARVALAASGYAVKVDRYPEGDRPYLLARLVVHDEPGEPDETIAGLDSAIDVRQTNRRRFDSDMVPHQLMAELLDAGRQEGAEALAIERDEDRLAVASLSQLADQIENSDPAYRAELRAWTSDDPTRNDGVPAFAVPHVDGRSGDDLPIRDFDARGTAELPGQTHSSLRQGLLLLGSLEDTRMEWLRVGEALEHVLLRIAAQGYTASPLTQVIEVTRTNVLLRQELRLGMHPHVLLRIGRAASTPSTRRRRLVDVISESS